MAAGSLVYVGIAPHPPIMVPEVGGEMIREVRGSIDAMRELTARVTAAGAETVIIVSPHAPLEARAFVAYSDQDLRGDFARFRAAAAEVSAPLDSELLDALERAADAEGFRVARLRGEELDHGTAVPLYFLLRNGWRGRAVALGYSFLSDDEHLRFGATLRRAADSVARRVALVASGDLSHRLKHDAPAGYHPNAHLFDEQVVASIDACAPRRIAEIDPKLRRLAGECGYRSMLVALGATESLDADCEVLHYEAPFGVGYLVAQLSRSIEARGDAPRTDAVGAQGAREDDDPAEVEHSSEKSSSAQTSEGGSAADEIAAVENFDDEDAADESLDDGADDAASSLPALARRAVETFVREGRAPEAAEVLDDEPPPVLARPAACFVSIKTAEGDLRGCIGTVEPSRASLADELIANAVSAATRDPRFPPVAESELASLRYSVDILHEPEPAEFVDLDPKVYGVIVEDEQGRRRGLLLPDIAGVETAAEQVQIAARKAGISPRESVRLYRFRVERFRENFGHGQTSE
ncbi:MAG TPA: AmmeMemoRadiSam system protein A [Pyrinomonadaceae bacterium]